MITPLRPVAAVLLFAFVMASCSSERHEEEKPAHELPFSALSLDDLGQFVAPEKENWAVAGNVFMDRLTAHHAEVADGSGLVVSRNDQGRLTTVLQHGDIDLKFDFMLAKDAEAQIFLQGCYGLSLRDSWDQDSLSGQTAGVILAGDGIRLPSLNVAKAPGLWQHLVIRFRAPRFDASGKKVTDAIFTEVILNGKRIHQDVVLNTVSLQAPSAEEKQAAPLVMVSRSGPVAFRNIRYKLYDDKRITINDVRYAVYKGLYKEYDTLRSLTPMRSGSADSIHWASGDKRAQIKFEGELDVPAEGDYIFKLRAGGPAWVLLDNKVVTGNRGTRDYTDAYYGKVMLKKGVCPFQVIYANYDESLVVEYEGPGIPLTRLTAPTAERLVRPIEPLAYNTGNRPGIQRAFFTHRGKVNPYTICVGTPGGLNYAYDLTTCALMDVWSGKFIDVGNMWRSRGESQLALPLGAPLELANIPPVLQLSDPADVWVDTVDVMNNRYTQRGYRLDAYGLPVFLYSYQGLAIEDHLHPASDQHGWVRSIHGKGTAAGNIYYLLGSGKKVEALPTGGYAIDDKEYYITAISGVDPKDLLIAEKKDRQELLLPLTLSPEGTLNFNYSIVW